MFARFNTYFQTGTSVTLSFNYGLKDYILLPSSQQQGRGRQVLIDYIEMPSVDQFVSNFKLVQSLGMKTSLSFDYLNHLNPGLAGGSAEVVKDESLFTEDELFDDRYGYSGHEFSALFTHYLHAYVKLQLGASRSWKTYLNRNVYDVQGNLSLIDQSRQDDRFIAWFEISRSLKLNWGIKTLNLSLQGGYLQNDSNDSYYLDHCKISKRIDN